jgi:large subunit ribosomal protein L54
MSTMPKQIPIHAQAGDIVSHGEADGVRENLEAAEKTIAARREITKSQRSARRKAIKEDNFLRGV